MSSGVIRSIPSQLTSSRRTAALNASRARIAILAAASLPVTSSVWIGLGVAELLRVPRASGVRGPSASHLGEDVVGRAVDDPVDPVEGGAVSGLPPSPGWPAPRPPPRPRSAAGRGARGAESNTSSPCCESSCLFMVTTWFSGLQGPWRTGVGAGAGSTLPMSSTIRSLRATMSSKSPLLRVSTLESSGWSPHLRLDRAGAPRGALANAEPTVPWPSSPTRKGHRHPGPQVRVGLAANDHAGVAVTAEEHRGPRHGVAVAGHRVTVGAGGRNHQRVSPG